MATWDDVDVDFGGDETGNFGPRLESGSALYQVDTAATISPKGEVTKVPHVTAYAIAEDVCVAVDGHVSIFQDAGHDFLTTLNLESDVDALSYSEDGHFLVVVDQAGKMHLIDVQSQMVLFSKAVVQQTGDGPAFRQVFFTSEDEEGNSCLILLTVAGQMHVFSKLPLTDLYQALSSGDVAGAKVLQNRMKHCLVDTCTVHTRITTAAAVLRVQYGHPVLATAGAGECTLCIWQHDHAKETYEPIRRHHVKSYAPGYSIVKMQVAGCGRYLVMLTEQHELLVYSTVSLLFLRRWNKTKLEDFVLLDSAENNSSMTGMKVVLVAPSGDGTKQLQVCSLPKLQPVYTIQLGSRVQLAQCPAFQEGIFVVEEVTEDDSMTPDLPSSLRVRCLTEAQPETRFYRLLNKHQFEEAEAFAKQFNLDVELVYRMKSSYLLEKIAPWNADPISSEQLEDAVVQLKHCLTFIKDESHVVDCCVNATPPSFAATLDLLNYAQQRLKESMAQQNGHVAAEDLARPQLITRVLETLHRLATYQVTFGVQHFRASQWHHFQKVDLLSELLRYLCQANTSIAFTIWRRHQIEFKEEFIEDVLSDILSSIPEHTSSDELRPWLAQDLIPYTLRILPESVGLLATWLEQRARNMELLEKESWPMNAVQLCELLHASCMSVTESASVRGMSTPEAFATQLCNLSVGYSQLNDSKHDAETDVNPFVRLHTLMGHLRDLHGLHTRYNCRLSLAEYMQETTESLTYRMLDRVVAIELVPQVIADVVRPYMKEHGLSEDRMLFQYIGDLAQRSGKVRSYLGEAPWEAKAIAVIGCIQDAEYKGRGILDAMMRAYTPWSPDMEALVKQGLALHHSRVAEIEEKCRLIQLKNMLIAYDLRHFDIGNNRAAERLVYYILSQDRPTAIEDALAVVNAYNLSENMAYLFRLRQLVKANKVHECLELLQGLPRENSVICARSLVNHACIQLGETMFQQLKSVQLEKILLTQAACRAIRMLLALDDIDEAERVELEDLLPIISNISALQMEFSEFLSIPSYRCGDIRKNLLIKYTRAFFSNKTDVGKNFDEESLSSEKKCTGSTPLSRTKLLRLSRVLGFTREEFRGQLALASAKSGDLATAIRICRELFEYVPTAATGRVMYNVAHQLSLLMQKPASSQSILTAREMPAAILELASKALIVCPMSMKVDCLELSKGASLAYDIARQCESGDYGITVQRHSKQTAGSVDLDPYEEWTFSPLFQEDGLVMDSANILPLVYAFTGTIMPNIDTVRTIPYSQDRLQGRNMAPAVEGTSSALTQLSTCTMPLVQHLRENSQMELALRVGIQALSTAIQHVSVNMPCQQEELTVLEAMVKRGLSDMKDLIAILMVKVFNKTAVDHSFALGLTCSLSTATAWERLAKIWERAGLHYKRILSVSKVGIDLAEILKEPKFLAKCKELERNAYWGHRLAKLKIDVKDAFSFQGEKKDMVIEQMVQSDAVDVNLLLEYCRAFKSPVELVLLPYVKYLLLPQTPSSVAPDLAEQDQRWARLEGKAQQAVDEMDSFPADELLKLLKKLDPYDYRRLEFLLKVIFNRTAGPDIEQGARLLQYLTQYKRVAAPSDYEVNYKPVTEEDQLMYGSVSLAPGSKERLPFHPFIYGEPWKIISPELNGDTVDVWLPVINLLRLSSDQMYLTAIQNMVKEHVKKSSATPSGDKAKCNWDAEEGVNHKFFERVQTLLMNVSNCEMAVMCSNWLVKELPMGAEKVIALQACAQLAEKWVGACPDGCAEKKKAEEAYIKFSQYYCRLSTEQVLFLNGLGEPALLDLARSPQRLIVRLFEHPSISEGAGGQHGPDIHKVAIAVGRISNLSVNKIRLNLVEQWLPSSLQNKQYEADMTITYDAHANLDMTVRTEEDVDEDEVNLKRVIYLLQHGSLETNAMFLLNYTFKSNTTKISNMCRVRALRCLFSLVDRETIEKLYSNPVSQIRECLQNLLFVMELERLHVPQTPEAFQKCSKEGLVRSLFRNHSHQRRAVRLVSDICLDYEIYDVTLWNSILQQLLAFEMMEYLRHVLVQLSRVPSLWQVDCVQRMWRSVLLAPLVQAVAPLSEQQLKECMTSANLLHRCPLLLDMDVMMFAKHFARLELPVLALACAQLLPDDAKCQQQMEALMNEYPLVEVLDQLADWTQKGYTVPMNEQIQQALFLYADTKGLYGELEESRYLPQMITYLIQSEAIDKLLLHCLKQNRLSEAGQVVKLYLQAHPSTPLMAPTGGDQDVDRLRAFLMSHGLRKEAMTYLPEPQPEPEPLIKKVSSPKPLPVHF